MKFGVVVFPGSNCDHDAYHVLKHVLGFPTVFLWHKETDLQDVDTVVVPGGFSFGDYLRCGAIAKFSPIMKSIKRHARSGNPVLGICNGFQILQEAGLLPGVLLRNRGLKFLCQTVTLCTVNPDTLFTRNLPPGTLLRIPIAHNEGNFFMPPDQLKKLEQRGQVVFRYCDASGAVTQAGNPNGSLNNIAGIVNQAGNVLGMMPHPERASEPLLGSIDGRQVFLSLVSALDRVN